MSAQQLADACSRLGLPIARSVLANFESGRRPTLSVAELLVLAKALGVPPIALLFAPAQAEELEVLPGRTVPTWNAMKWFNGEEPLYSRPAGAETEWAVDPAEAAEWQADLSGIVDYRWHEQYLKDWAEARGAAAKARDAAAEAGRSDAEREALLREAGARDQLAATFEGPLYEARRRLRGNGFLLPSLPTELQHIDADSYKPDWGWMRK